VRVLRNTAANLGVSPAPADEQSGLQFLRGQLLAGVTGAGHGFAAGAEFGARAFGPGAGVEPIEDLRRGAQLDARVTPPPGTAQPLSVAQVRAGLQERRLRAALVQLNRLQEMGSKSPAETIALDRAARAAKWGLTLPATRARYSGSSTRACSIDPARAYASIRSGTGKVYASEYPQPPASRRISS
jgi:hypothetical protein